MRAHDFGRCLWNQQQQPHDDMIELSAWGKRSRYGDGREKRFNPSTKVCWSAASAGFHRKTPTRVPCVLREIYLSEWTRGCVRRWWLFRR